MKNYKIKITIMFALIAAMIVGTGLIHLDNFTQGSIAPVVEVTNHVA
jgi:hypothetical protein